MKAVMYRAYGPPDVLHLEDVEKPTPGDDDVLIKVRAAGANPMDYHFMGGTYVMRFATGLRKPKPTIPGVDLAGEVEAVGKNVRRFRPGDSVFGVGRGTFAEYVCTPENRLALKPANLAFEQAAALPVAGLTALQAIRDKGHVVAGQSVLINGAAGGVGSFAVQIAKSLGASVTGVCSSGSVEFVRSLGADRVVDYTHDNFTLDTERYDVALDCVGNRTLSAVRRVVRANGIILPVGFKGGGRWLGPVPHLVNVFVASKFVSQKIVFFVARANSDELAALSALVESTKVTPAIDRTYRLGEAAEAIRHLKEGHVRGKVVLVL